MQDSKYVAGWEKLGELKAQRKPLLRVLKLRTQNPLPPDFVEAVNECDDPNELDRWIDLAATTASLGDFRAQADL